MEALGITLAAFFGTCAMCSYFIVQAYLAWNETKSIRRAEYFAARK